MIRIVLISVGTFLVGLLLASVFNSNNLEQIQREHDDKVADLTRELSESHANLADALALPERPVAAVMVETPLPEAVEATIGPVKEEPLLDDTTIIDAIVSESEDIEDDGNRAERERRGAERFQQMRDRYMGMMDEYWENADPKTQERITAMVEYQEQIFELGQEMRNAESDEDRAAIRETMRDTMDELQKTVKTQQNSMLGDVAKEYGIEGKKAQREFSNAVRDVIGNPLFSGGSFGRGGGFSGGGGRGGGAGRRPSGGGENRGGGNRAGSGQ